MKRILPVLLIIVSLSYFSSCEKDDICVEGDTPFLVIGFYDFEDTLSFKRVPSLRVIEVQLDTILIDRQNTNDSIQLPLRIEDTSTSFTMINNSRDNNANNEIGTTDTLTFNYAVNPEYISRPCGFIANFNELDTIREVFSTDWIKGISIINPNVERSNQIHVKIFH